MCRPIFPVTVVLQFNTNDTIEAFILQSLHHFQPVYNPVSRDSVAPPIFTKTTRVMENRAKIPVQIVRFLIENSVFGVNVQYFMGKFV